MTRAPTARVAPPVAPRGRVARAGAPTRYHPSGPSPSAAPAAPLGLSFAPQPHGPGAHMPDHPLYSWRTFYKAIASMDEETCWRLLAMERASDRRTVIMQRLYARANMLRSIREKEEL